MCSPAIWRVLSNVFFHTFQILSLFNWLFFHIFHIFSLFNLFFFRIFHIFSLFSSIFSIPFHNWLPHFQYMFTIQQGFLPYFDESSKCCDIRHGLFNYLCLLCFVFSFISPFFLCFPCFLFLISTSHHNTSNCLPPPLPSSSSTSFSSSSCSSTTTTTAIALNVHPKHEKT